MLNLFLIFLSILIVIAFIGAIFLIKWIDGAFSYEDEVVEERILGDTKPTITKRFIIKRTYNNGKIKFITQDIKI